MQRVSYCDVGNSDESNDHVRKNNHALIYVYLSRAHQYCNMSIEFHVIAVTSWHCIALRIATDELTEWTFCVWCLTSMSKKSDAHEISCESHGPNLDNKCEGKLFFWGIALLLSLVFVVCSTSLMCMVVETYVLCGVCLRAQDRPSSSRRWCWFMRETIGDTLC